MNVLEKIELLEDYFSPKIIGEVNDIYVKIVKILGNKVPWHIHENEDELFYVIEGELLFEIEGKCSFSMKTGDIFIVSKRIKHRVSSTKVCKIMLIEPKTTVHTGNTKVDITKSIDEQLFL